MKNICSDMTCGYNKKYIAFDSSILAGRIFLSLVTMDGGKKPKERF